MQTADDLPRLPAIDPIEPLQAIPKNKQTRLPLELPPQPPV